jgi:hypothetical protein
LLTPPATLIEDLFGPVDYRRGQGRPRVNLWEAINALLRGELPSSPETSITPPLTPDSFQYIAHGTFFDAANGLITTWTASQSQPVLTEQIFAARLSLDRPEAGFDTIQPITGPGRGGSHATLLDTGEVLIVYTTGQNIVMKRGMLAALNPESEEKAVTSTPAQSRQAPFAVSAGGQVLIFFLQTVQTQGSPAVHTLKSIRYDVTSDSFGQAEDLSDFEFLPTVVDRLHATRDSTNTVWVAFDRTQQLGGIRVIPVPPVGSPGSPQDLSSSRISGDNHPFVMVDNSDNIYVFWSSGRGSETGIWYHRFLRETMAWEPGDSLQVPGTTTGTSNITPTAVSDTEGGIWLFWASERSGNADIWYVRHNPVTQLWSDPKQITARKGRNGRPFVLHGADGSLWLFWTRNFQPFSGAELVYQRIFPSI